MPARAFRRLLLRLAVQLGQFADGLVDGGCQKIDLGRMFEVASDPKRHLIAVSEDSYTGAKARGDRHGGTYFDQPSAEEIKRFSRPGTDLRRGFRGRAGVERGGGRRVSAGPLS